MCSAHACIPGFVCFLFFEGGKATQNEKEKGTYPNKNSTKNIRHTLKKYLDMPTVTSHTRMLPAGLKP